MSLYNIINTEPCVTLVYSQPLYLQALLRTQEILRTLSNIHNGSFSAEHCVTLTYSELEAYSEPCQISMMEKFIQNHV